MKKNENVNAVAYILGGTGVGLAGFSFAANDNQQASFWIGIGLIGLCVLLLWAVKCDRG